MALQIIGQDDDLPRKTREAIENALTGAQVEVVPTGPGHVEIRVVSEAFAGKSRVKQQQLVYGAITELMGGENPPLHAVDRMETITPESDPG